MSGKAAAAAGSAPRPIIIIKKKGGHGGHHGGAWKVAYADFVTAMMALFMVLWLVSQTDQVQREIISHYFRTGVFPDGGTSLLEQGEGLKDGKTGFTDSSNSFIDPPMEQQEMENAAQRIRQAVTSKPALKLTAKSMRVRTIDRGLLIELVDGGDEMLFELSSSALRPKLIELLQAIAPALQALNNPIEVHGHTDARPFPAGAGRDNWSLSFERAAAARDILAGAGVSDGHFAGVFAHGSSDLFDRKDPLSSTNRRISILAVRKAQRISGLSSAPTVTRQVIERAMNDAGGSKQGEAPAPAPAAH